MTVKELKAILNGCNDDADFVIETGHVLYETHGYQVFHTQIGGMNRVVVDVTYGDDTPSIEIKTSGAYPSFIDFTGIIPMKKDGE